MDNLVAQGRKAPLVFVLTSVRFQQLEALPRWIADIQDILRSRLPIFQRFHQDTLPGPQIGFAIDPPDFKPDAPGSAWLFSKSDRSLTVQISKGVFTVHTRAYDGYAGFAEDVLFALSAFMASAKEVHVDSAGIRYLNHLHEENGRGLSEILPPSLLPHPAEWNEKASLVAGTSTSVYDLDEDKLRGTVWTGAEVNVIPDDLAVAYITGQNLEALVNSNEPPIAKLSQNEATLDTDAFRLYVPTRRMQSEEIMVEIERLHRHANEFYRATT